MRTGSITPRPSSGAREMDPAANLELVRYFHDRHVWLVEPERDVLKLTDYPRVSSK
jgi:hypothetical protein